MVERLGVERAPRRAVIAARAWRGALFAALLASTWLLLAPGQPAAGDALPYGDKLGHAALFGVLAVLARLGYRSHPPWGAFAALVLYGAAIEWAQRGVPGRSADALDLAADALGAAVAFALRRR